MIFMLFCARKIGRNRRRAPTHAKVKRAQATHLHRVLYLSHQMRAKVCCPVCPLHFILTSMLVVAVTRPQTIAPYLALPFPCSPSRHIPTVPCCLRFACFITMFYAACIRSSLLCSGEKTACVACAGVVVSCASVPNERTARALKTAAHQWVRTWY